MIFRSIRCAFTCLLVYVAVSTASAQKTTDITFNSSVDSAQVKSGLQRVAGTANGSIAALGAAIVHLEISQPMDSQGNALDDFRGVLSFVFNRLDGFDVSIIIPNGNGNPPPIAGTISAGNGVYKGATGSVTVTISGVDGSRSFALIATSYPISANGSVIVSGKTTAFTLPSTTLIPYPLPVRFGSSITGTGTITPGGNVTLKGFAHGGGANNRQSGSLTATFNASDSFSIWFSFVGDLPPPNFLALIYGGTGAYAGAAGRVSLTLGLGTSDSNFTVTGTGTITTGVAPVITEVSTAFGVPELAQNTWIVIKGTNLVPANTPSAGVTWSDASSFASGKMPTDLRGVSVLVNGLPAYVYFFCSAVTDSACAKDQINVLTPLDTIAPAGPTASVVVTNNGVSSPAFIVDRTAQIQPSFLLFSARGDVVAVHLDGSLVGPVTLYPGASTPAKAGETVLLFPIGFGLPSTPVVNGSATQSGPLPGTVLCFVGTKLATVPGAIISPGLTQLNLVIPAGTPTGDNLIWCGYAIPDGPRSQTPAGNLIAVQ